MADTLDVLTLAEAKLAIANNAGTTNDTLLAGWVTGVSRFFDQLCGPIVQRTITAELHDGGFDFVDLNFRPVSSVTTVSEYLYTTEQALTEETPGVQPQYAFVTDPLAGLVRRRRAGRDTAFAVGRRNVKVTYVAGRYANTASVDERFKRAAAITLANVWRREHGNAGAVGLLGVTYGLPDAAKAFIYQDIQGVVGV